MNPAIIRFSRICAGQGDAAKFKVGGNGLNSAPEPWKGLGADGYAETAEDALTVADIFFL